jgi:hypothetical protein
MAVFTHKAGIAVHHLGHASGHHLEEAMVEVVVEGHVEHQGVLGVEGSGLLWAGGGGMAKRQLPAGLQGHHQFTAAGVMGPQAAHMQELEPWLGNPFRSGIAKERGR